MKKYFLFLTLVVSNALCAADQQGGSGQDQRAQQMYPAGLGNDEVIRQQRLRDLREEQDGLQNIIEIYMEFSVAGGGPENAQVIEDCRRELAEIEVAINRLNAQNNLPAVQNNIPDDGLGQ